MENYSQGDLTDILRATGSVMSQEWQLSSNSINYPPEPPVEDFGNPFTGHFRDPLLHDHHLFQAVEPPVSRFSFTYSSNTVEDSSADYVPTARLDLDNDKMLKVPSSSIFSRMLQISPHPPRGSLALISPDNNVCKGFLENPGMQISAQRNNSGIKRRKSQAKKVVCIPAPAPANSRPSSGEIVPSDLWAWRKYGQKPIKGSPYPRGYYRCSSSKGCSARKQVERSRTDPNMLVITYTSEHNHPWPTQRNALAGSTRAHNPAKKNQQLNDQNLKDNNNEHMEITADNVSVTEDPDSLSVKAEMDQEDDNQFDMDDPDFDDRLPHGYKSTHVDGLSNSEESFFADLGEIDTDPFGFNY